MYINDIVSRRSYNNDILFKVIDIKGKNIILQGIDFRLIADADISDLQEVNVRGLYNESKDSSINLFKTWYINQFDKNINKDRNYSLNINNNVDKSVYKKYGKILHIDGDKFYLSECMRKYKELGVPCIGISIEESRQPEVILDLLNEYKPNILVITGHDSIIKNTQYYHDINCYKNSKYYLESVKIARTYNCSYDELVIIAGGCKSYYEALMNAGANFAASPDRILINVIDPVIVACNIAKTSVREFVDIDSIIMNTSAGLRGIGGIETRGQCRECKPKF